MSQDTITPEIAVDKKAKVAELGPVPESNSENIQKMAHVEVAEAPFIVEPYKVSVIFDAEDNPLGEERGPLLSGKQYGIVATIDLGGDSKVAVLRYADNPNPQASELPLPTFILGTVNEQDNGSVYIEHTTELVDKQAYLIGRGNDVIEAMEFPEKPFYKVPDAPGTVSRTHARLQTDGDRIHVFDEHSTNGTSVEAIELSTHNMNIEQLG